MPDMQTALKSALSQTLREWDDDGEESPQPSTINTTINNAVSTPSQATKMINAHKITNNVSRETFNYVKNNPGSTRLEIIKELGHQGFGKGSISSLLAQMRRSKMIHDTNGLWYADVKEYAPIKNYNYKSKAKPKPEKKATTGLGALLKAKLENTPMPNPSQAAMDAAAYAMTGQEPTTNKRLVSLVRNREPQDILKDMTVYQAHELYVRLKQLFGG
jgi:hypothetical protein